MLVKSMYQIACIEFTNAKFPWTPVFVTDFTAPRGEAILDPPVQGSLTSQSSGSSSSGDTS